MPAALDPVSSPHPDLPDVSESEWVDRACERDPEAFEVLARAAMPMLLGTARRLVGPGYRAEEAVAEALFRAWRGIDSFRGASGFGTWLHRILCRSIADRYRRLGRQRARDEGLRGQVEAGTSPGGTPRPSPTPWQACVARDEATQWRSLLEGLPPTQRLVLLLHAWENLSLAEVSETLGLRYATVKSHLHHARKALREAARRTSPPRRETS